MYTSRYLDTYDTSFGVFSIRYTTRLDGKRGWIDVGDEHFLVLSPGENRHFGRGKTFYWREDPPKWIPKRFRRRTMLEAIESAKQWIIKRESFYRDQHRRELAIIDSINEKLREAKVI